METLFFFFAAPIAWHVEVPRPEIEPVLQHSLAFPANPGQVEAARVFIKHLVPEKSEKRTEEGVRGWRKPGEGNPSLKYICDLGYLFL